MFILTGLLHTLWYIGKDKLKTKIPYELTTCFGTPSLPPLKTYSTCQDCLATSCSTSIFQETTFFFLLQVFILFSVPLLLKLVTFSKALYYSPPQAYFSCNPVFSFFNHPRMMCFFFPDGFNLILSLFLLVSLCTSFAARKQGQRKSVHIILTSLYALTDVNCHLSHMQQVSETIAIKLSYFCSGQICKCGLSKSKSGS